jgi:hypothetical protein
MSATQPVTARLLIFSGRADPEWTFEGEVLATLVGHAAILLVVGVPLIARSAGINSRDFQERRGNPAGTARHPGHREPAFCLRRLSSPDQHVR